MRRRTLLVAVCALGLLSPAASAQELHSDLCNFGCPVQALSDNDDDIIVRPIYVLRTDDRTKFARWVAYKVTAETIGPSESRNWKPDPLLAPDERVEPADYTDAHAVIKTDRGHLVPLASFSGTPHWRLTNLLSNITPQMSDLNQGPWRFLEEAVRDLARKPSIDGVYVMTGPIYERDMPELPGADENHRVPSGYWKVVSIADGERISVAAFIFDQFVDRAASYCGFIEELRDVERTANLKFFHALDQYARDRRDAMIAPLAQELGC